MPEGRGLWGRLAVLAAAVLATHLWLLAGVPRVQERLRPPPAWTIRALAPPVAALVAEPELSQAPVPNRAVRGEAPASRISTARTYARPVVAAQPEGRAL